MVITTDGTDVLFLLPHVRKKVKEYVFTYVRIWKRSVRSVRHTIQSLQASQNSPVRCLSVRRQGGLRHLAALPFSLQRIAIPSCQGSDRSAILPVRAASIAGGKLGGNSVRLCNMLKINDMGPFGSISLRGRCDTHCFVSYRLCWSRTLKRRTRT
jgi:hypothetical protein